MDPVALSVEDLLERDATHEPPELRRLFHQLNNQLGIILAHAELMERKLADETSRARATEVVGAVLAAMTTSKQIRIELGTRGSNT
jgi:hypothetical protein